MPMKLEHPQKKRLKSAFTLKAPNDSETIERIQGLAIQPFIFAICAVQNDITAHLEHQQFRANTEFLRDRQAACALDRALGDAGYSGQGNPYWVDRHRGEPTPGQIEKISIAAKRCQPMLIDRYMIITKGSNRDTPATRTALQAYGARMQAFDEAIREFDDMVAIHKESQRDKTVTGRNYKCALD